MEVAGNFAVDGGERASTEDPTRDATRTEGGMPTTAYPRLLRIFIGSTVAAALCGLAALAADGSKGLHPAPFLALATLLAIAAACAFLSMLTCLLTEAAVLWWRKR
ncbi:hypothetical protein CSC73_06785 [Pseudoxanthomonas sacheonensis]|nr:hypothetical protein CSC73_06785 [Pseudoxanthomonas sacheonensis]